MEAKEKRTYKKPEQLNPNKTYKCSKCGAYLPLKMFHVYADGTRFRHICKRCLGEECYKDERFANFTSRDMILELRARGYIGKLQFKKVITEDVDI
ncbi:MAG: hypothetical protein MR765_03985 [Tenericutes bacterium]|nr:hypothetical protein [Mycoplasmatota bacterium]